MLIFALHRKSYIENSQLKGQNFDLDEAETRERQEV